MAIFIEASGVQEQGSWFLQILASHNTELRSKVKLAGAESCVEAARDAHSENPRVLACVAACMEVLQVDQSSFPAASPSKGDKPKSAKKKLLSLFSRS